MPFRNSRHSSRHSVLNDHSLLKTTQSQPSLFLSDNSKEQSWISLDSVLFSKRDDLPSINDLKENQTGGKNGSRDGRLLLIPFLF